MNSWLLSSDAYGIVRRMSLVTYGIVRQLSFAEDAVRHQMLVASHAATPLGVAKWLVGDAYTDKRLPLGRRLGRRLFGRDKSLHHIFRLVVDARLPEEICQFLLKRHLPVMLPLILDITLYCRNQRFAIGESPISTLPTETAMKEIVVYPLRRLDFQRLHKVSHRFTRMHANENMNMVGSAVDSMYEVLAVLACADDIAVEIVLPSFIDESLAMADGKNEVHVDLGVGVGHLLILISVKSHTYGMLLILIPSFSSHFAVPTAQLHGWLPSSDAYGIVQRLISACKVKQ